MHFLCDLGVSMKVVDWLRAQGHDAVHLRDEGLHRLPNGEIFAKAVHEGRIILTFDLDFSEIAAMCRERIASVVVFRLRNSRPENVILRLTAVLAHAGPALRNGAVVAVEESKLRIREFPISDSR